MRPQLKTFVLFMAMAVLACTFLSMKRDSLEPRIGHYVDEAAIVLSTYYYYLAFIKGDFGHPDWQAYDAYDHPPLYKFFYGWVLSWFGFERHSLADRIWWHEVMFNLCDPQQAVDRMNQLISPREITIVRSVSMAFGVGCVMMTLLLGWSLLGPLEASSAALFLVVWPLFHNKVVLGIFDAQFVFLVLVFLWLLWRWTTSIVGGDKKWLRHAAYGGGLALVAALAFIDKILGAVLHLFWLIWILLVMVLAKDRKQIAFVGWTVAGIALSGFFIWLFDPTLWPNFWAGVTRMFQHRWEMLAHQSVAFEHSFIPTWSGRFFILLSWLFFARDPFYELAGFSIVMPLVSLGLGFLLHHVAKTQLDRVPWGSWYLLATFGSWFVTVWYSLQMNWGHYVLPLTPLVVLVMFYGLRALRLAVSARHRPWRAALFGLAIFLSLGTAMGMIGRMSYTLTDPRILSQREAVRAQMRERCLSLPQAPTGVL